MEVIVDVKKMVNQILGRENMFDFQTTLANQLYLIYCLTSNIYFTDKIHLKTKWFWLFFSCSGLSMIIFPVLLYPKYCDRTKDILVLTYLGFALAIASLILIVRPAIAQLLYKTDIERMILMVDKIILKNPTNKSQSSRQSDMKKVIKNVVIACWSSLIPYTFVTIVDMALFYEEDKVKNPMYYIVPLCGVDSFGSLTFYILYAVLTVTTCAPFFFICTIHLIFPVLWVTIGCNEAQRIIDELNSLNAEDVIIDIETYKSLEPRFRDTIKKSARDIDDLTKMISHFRGYFESTSGVTMSMYLYIAIVHALIMVTPNYPYIVRIRELSVFIWTLLDIYLMCWVGAKLEEMTTNISFAVYSTPWYWLKSVRKDVYILLCQAQSPIEPLALGVYPLKLATFMRFCNTINSAVNVFRAYTEKH